MKPTECIINKIKSLAADGQIMAAENLVDDALLKHPDDSELLFQKGKLLWKEGKRAEAMSWYIKSAEINPVGPAARAIEMSRDIESYFNPDLLNP